MLEEIESELQDWRRRDAHEFVLATCLGIGFFLEAVQAIGLFISHAGSFNPNTVTIFLRAFLGAYFSTFLAYALFVAARWLPPAAQCSCCSAVPSALFRLGALLACIAYAFGAGRALAAAYDDSPWAAQVPAAAEDADEPNTTPIEELVAAATLLTFCSLELVWLVCAAAVVARRLWLQVSEDERPWLYLGSTEKRGRAARASREMV